MDTTVLAYAALNLFGVFISAISQVMLKKSAMREHSSAVAEYLNPLVIFAYTLFVAATLLSVIAYRGIPLSMGPILDATGYIYVTAFGVLIFHEKLNARRVFALALIIVGIVIYSLSV
ncbi:multidrug ABC transporter [Enorma phocaeensis]|uniref:multidrug ABC transporter n=1 Tax=Enorma phocaeensis TaxID=1871019 RepID=UPI003207DF37